MTPEEHHGQKETPGRFKPTQPYSHLTEIGNSVGKIPPNPEPITKPMPNTTLSILGALPTPVQSPTQKLDRNEHSIWGVRRIGNMALEESTNLLDIENKYDIGTTENNDLRISTTNFPCKNLDTSGEISNLSPSRYHTTEVHPTLKTDQSGYTKKTQDLTLVADTKVEDN